MSRIGLTDSIQDILCNMSDGNPGALVAMLQLIEHTPNIDPQNVLGGFGVIMSLNDMKIYGTDIAVLFSDKCDKDPRKFNLLMRGRQLGKLPESRIQELAADQSRSIKMTQEEWDKIEEAVLEELTDFQRV